MLNKNLALMVLVAFAAGCGVQAKTYVMEKERIQGAGGNGGCLKSPCPQEPAPEKKTRKIYVLEVTKPVPASEVDKIERGVSAAAPSQVEAPPVGGDQPSAADQQLKIAAPAVEEKSAPAGQAYTVLKDDTLQKIAKKFYGSYSKWTKIYEANKGKIKNPNLVRPGTVLTIPEVK